LLKVIFLYAVYPSDFSIPFSDDVDAAACYMKSTIKDVVAAMCNIIHAESHFIKKGKWFLAPQQ
jgi:hypothetical protein